MFRLSLQTEGTLAGGFAVTATEVVTVSIDAHDKAAPCSDLAANVNISEVVGFVNRNRMRLFIYLTACVSLYYKGEGEGY